MSSLTDSLIQNYGLNLHTFGRRSNQVQNYGWTSYLMTGQIVLSARVQIDHLVNVFRNHGVMCTVCFKSSLQGQIVHAPLHSSCNLHF